MGAERQRKRKFKQSIIGYPPLISKDFNKVKWDEFIATNPHLNTVINIYSYGENNLFRLIAELCVIIDDQQKEMIKMAALIPPEPLREDEKKSLHY